MKKSRLILGFVFSLLAMTSYAQIPKTISFQGVLADNTGAVVSAGNYAFEFRIFDVSTGGSFLWNETHPVVAVSADGLYNISLGSVTPFNIDFDKTYYLELVVDAEVMSPRIELASSAYVNNINLRDLSDGVLTGSKVGSGISADSITTGNLSTSLMDTDLQDLADGELSGDKVGSGIIADNITTGALSIANGGTGGTTVTDARTNLGLGLGSDVQTWDADLDDLADGSLSGGLVGSGIDAANITTGTLPLARLTELTSSNLSTSAGITGAQILDATITSADISGAAGITTGQILNGTLTSADLSASAGIASGQITSLDAAKVTGITTGYIPRSTGSALTTGSISDNGTTVGIGSSSSSYKLYIYSSGTESRAIYARNLSTTNATNYGIYGSASGSTTLAYGIYGTANAPTYSYGVVGYGSGGASSNFGMYGSASNSISGTINYGVYGTASGTGATNYAGYFSGNVAYTGTISDVSDIRLKKNIHDLTGSLNKISKLRGISFQMIDSEDPVIENGFSAQEVEAIFPELVADKGDGYKTLNYVGLIAPIVESIQEQQIIIESQAREIERLKSDNGIVKTQVEELAKRLAVLESYLTSKASEK